MKEGKLDCASSTDAGSPAHQPNKRKRKVEREQSSDSSSKQSKTPVPAGKRPKKTPRSTQPSEGGQFGDAGKSNDEANGSGAGHKDSTALKTPSPKSTHAQPSHTPPESPTRTFLNFLDGLPYPSTTQAAASLASDRSLEPNCINPISSHSYPNKKASRPHLHTENMMHPNAPAWGPVHPVPATPGYGQLWPSFPIPMSRHGLPYHCSPSPLGQIGNHSGGPGPLMEQQRQHIVRQQMMAQLYQESQKHQQAQFSTAHRVMLQKAKENDPNREFFTYRNVTFTLRECLLACALKNFCKSLSDRPGEGLSDDTIAEILKHQRGWRDPNGLDCEGLCVALIRNGSWTREQIESSIRGDRHGWENYAWMSYWSWLGAMGQVCARLTAGAQMGVGAGHISGNVFGGNNHQLHNQDHFAPNTAARAQSISDNNYYQSVMAETAAAATLHPGRQHFNEERNGPNRNGAIHHSPSNDQAANLNSPFKKEGISQSEASQNDKCLPKMEVAVEDDVFGLE